MTSGTERAAASRSRTVSVVIPCRDAGSTLPVLVRSLVEQRLPDGIALEIIVVDNGSRDGGVERLAGAPIRVVREPTRGPAAARNAGVRAARGDVVVFLDADTRAAHPGFLAAHLATLDEMPDVAIAGGPITHDPRQRSLLAFAENATALLQWHEHMPAGRIAFQPSGNLAFRRELFDRIGPLDETLLCLEDFEWNVRAARAGGGIYFNPDARVYITGRESLRAILWKFYTWGLNVRLVYLPERRAQRWLFPRHRRLFALNGPFRACNETWVTVKRWFPVRPALTIALVPLFLLYRGAWGVGIAVGTFRDRHAALAAKPEPAAASRP